MTDYLNKEQLYNYNKTLLGCSLSLRPTDFQASKINQFVGSLRKVKNNKIAQITLHNNRYLNFAAFNEFKLNNPIIPNNQNPHKYIYPDQSYASCKQEAMDFIGPLTQDSYNQIYKNNKHYLERVPSELYRNSLKDIIEGNNKYIADVFDKNITYSNKRKPLKFIRKNDNRDSFLITKSDNMFTIKGNYICFGKHFEQSYAIEQEIKILSKQLKSILSKEEQVLLKTKIANLQNKLDKDISYLGKLKIVLPKDNKTSKVIDFNSINSIRIKKDKKKYSFSFTYENINEYKPCLLREDNKKEITTKENLAFYIKELTAINPQLALDYLQNKVLGLDRGIAERLAASQSINNKDNNFLSYSAEIKLKIQKLKRQIKYHNRQLKRRTLDSNGYNKSLNRFRKLNGNLANIRKNENHQTSYKIINKLDYPIIALEKLNIKGMTKKAIPKINIEKTIALPDNIKLGLIDTELNELVEKLTEYHKDNKNNLKYNEIVKNYKIVYDQNKASAKSGLNESMLNQNHGQLSEFLKYKANMQGKLVIEVPAAYSSQECSNCGNVDQTNRIKTKFCCNKCGYKDHADINASKVIASRVYKALLKYAEETIKKDAVKKKKEEKLIKEKISMECREEAQMMVL